MKDRYLLYIDILGFTDLVSESNARIQDLYEIIASLNVHDHPSFKAIIFSDTILVYNVEGDDTRGDRSYLVMYLCEFAQDLQRRLTEKDIFFRAVLVRGDFTHYELNQIPCFFGEALIRAYNVEKDIKAIGLFMQNDIIKDSDVFPTRSFAKDFNFVYITQSLTRVEEGHVGELPAIAWLMEDTDEIFHFTPEVLYLKRLRHHANNHPHESVREKYRATFKLFEQQYPKTLAFLEAHDFNIESCSPDADWGKAIEQWPQTYEWAVMQRTIY
jgi:hypothetical protein